MRHAFSAAAAAMALAAASASSAGVVGVTSSSQLGANDTIDWGQLGPVGTFVSSPATVTSTGGVAATVSDGGKGFGRLNQGNSWMGNFSPGAKLLWNENGGAVTIDFATPVRGAGAQIQADSQSPFTAKIVGSDGGVLGSFSENGVSNGNADNSAVFIGILSSKADITEIVFSLTVVANNNVNDFAIGALALNNGAGVPEPATWAMMLLGLGGIGALLRTNRGRALATA
jgi:hypothetical protein